MCLRLLKGSLFDDFKCNNALNSLCKIGASSDHSFSKSIIFSTTSYSSAVVSTSTSQIADFANVSPTLYTSTESPTIKWYSIKNDPEDEIFMNFYYSTIAMNNVIQIKDELFGISIFDQFFRDNCSITSAFSDNSELGNYLSQNELNSFINNCTLTNNMTINDLEYLLYRIKNSVYYINTGNQMNNSINVDSVK